MDNAFEIYKLLRSGSGAVSGESMGERLNISRAGVSKHITRLKKMGFDISSISHNGHTLTHKMSDYNAYTVQYELFKQDIPLPVHFLESTFSTNTDAKTQKYSEAEGLIVARKQQSGRGRKERVFVSEAGGIYMSYFAVPKNIRPYDAVKAVLLAGIAVTETLNSFGANAKLKWPNDVLVDGKKICGILCEMMTSSDHVQKLILGMGINIDNEMQGDVANVATSLKQLGLNADKNLIIAKTIKRLKELLTLLEEGRTEELLTLYLSHSLTIGLKVRVIEDGKVTEGIAEGIDGDGFLMVRTNDGLLKVVNADVSIRQ